MGKFIKGNAGKPKGSLGKNSRRKTINAIVKGNEKQLGIYIIKCGDSKFYKIGRTTDLNRRLYDIQSTNPYSISLCKFIECKDNNYYKILEKTIHLHLKNYNHHGEWFLLSDSLFAILMTVNTLEDANKLPELLKPNLFTILN